MQQSSPLVGHQQDIFDENNMTTQITFKENNLFDASMVKVVN